MKRALDTHEFLPLAMRQYLSFYGWHFSRAAYEYACHGMKKRNRQTLQMERVKPFTKAELDELLKTHGVEIDERGIYDYVYVATMCRADYLGSSVPDDKHLCLFVKDTLEDADASDETVFRRWLATCVGNGCPVDFDELIESEDD